MTSAMIDDGDLNRKTREETLTEEAPRALPREDAPHPPEHEGSILGQQASSPEGDEPKEPENKSGLEDMLVNAVIESIKRRL
jgi:hypothetical protein